MRVLEEFVAISKVVSRKMPGALKTLAGRLATAQPSAFDKAAFSGLERSAVREIAHYNAPVRKKAPQLLALKFEKMAENAHSYYRGVAHLFNDDLARLEAGALKKGPLSVVQGDLHLENLGAVEKALKKLRYRANDFDEASIGPVLVDLKRLATSIVLAGKQQGLAPAETRGLVAHLAEHYTKTLERLAKTGDAKVKAPAEIRQFLVKQSAIDPVQWLEKMAPSEAGKRAFARSKTTQSVAPKTLRDATSAFEHYRETLGKKASSKLEGLEVKDVVTQVSGTASMGRGRYRLLLAAPEGKAPRVWSGGKSPPQVKTMVFELKEAAGPLLVAHTGAKLPAANEAERVILAARVLNGKPNAYLGATAIGDTPFVVRRVFPSEGRLDLAKLTSEGAMGRLIAYDAGRIAKAHSNGKKVGLSGAKDILEGLGPKDDLSKTLQDFAHGYGQQVERDYRVFKAALRSDPLLSRM